MHHKKTKIVATIGPASNSKEKLAELSDAGLNVIRLNFSHGEHETHETIATRWRKVLEETGRNGAVMQDLCGPKIRTGEFVDESVTLDDGQTFTLTTREIEGTNERATISYKQLPQEVEKDDRILIDDGKCLLRVSDTTDTEVVCEVIKGGTIVGRRGVNVPDSDLSTPSLTEKDKVDAKFGVELGVDFVALSFVRDADDVRELRQLLDLHGSDAHIISKIETPQAVEDIDAIIEASDGIMVARGDLAVEISPENVPLIQKEIIAKCNTVGKPVITATQMLESMIETPVPTRAEVSDVANAILDGTDAIMLSGETAVGDYPVETVKIMSEVAKRIETSRTSRPERKISEENGKSIVDAVTSSVIQTAYDVNAEVIVALTDSGFSARMVARYKPKPTVLAFSQHAQTVRRLALSYGVWAYQRPPADDLDTLLEEIHDVVLSKRLASKGDKIVVTAGLPFSADEQETNMLLVEEL